MPHRKLKHIVGDQKLVHATPDNTVADIVKLMRDHHVSTALVLENGELKGIFTASNLVKKVLDPDLNPNKTPVSKVMTPDPICLPCDALGIDSIRVMRDENIRHVVVLDVGEKGYGIVSVRDFTNDEIEGFEEELEFEEKLWEIL